MSVEVTIPAKRYLRQPAAADYIGVSARTLRGLVAGDAIRPCRPSKRRIVFDIQDLDDFLARSKAPGKGR